jgi:abequosyltransferase
MKNNEDCHNINPLISFAIPTYNFGRFISETIRSIFDGCEHINANDIEVVVLDGGSTDDTEINIKRLSNIYANIKYQKNAKRGGIDRDLDEVAQLTSGRYIWLFSADDTLESGWDLPLIKALNEDPDIVLVPAMLCSLTMESIRPNPIFVTNSNEYIEKWLLDGDVKRIEDYLKSSKSLEALFGFLSAVVIKSTFWSSLPKREDYYGTCWAHCARLLPALRLKSKIIYINKIIINKRGENDSFMEGGFVSRISIAIDGWTRIINEFFKEESLRALLYKRLRRDISLPLLLYAKISTNDTRERSRLIDLAKKHYLINSITVSSVLTYTLFQVFPSNKLILDAVNRNITSLKKIRHAIRRVIG